MYTCLERHSMPTQRLALYLLYTSYRKKPWSRRWMLYRLQQVSCEHSCVQVSIMLCEKIMHVQGTLKVKNTKLYHCSHTYLIQLQYCKASTNSTYKRQRIPVGRISHSSILSGIGHQNVNALKSPIGHIYKEQFSNPYHPCGK